MMMPWVVFFMMNIIVIHTITSGMLELGVLTLNRSEQSGLQIFSFNFTVSVTAIDDYLKYALLDTGLTNQIH